MPAEFDPIEWLQHHVDFACSTSAVALYDNMESQSGFSLPGIYKPFDPDKRWHFVDRAQILDYAITTGPGRVLDFGPGDGWPSLLMAPFVRSVTGVDGSSRRVAVCRENAHRMGITNAAFLHVPPGEALPFPNDEFDGITAASSVEQTPDPRATLSELCRVLKPGGRLRMHYESLGYYAGGKERELWLGEVEGQTRITIYDRKIEKEEVQHYHLALDMKLEETRAALGINRNWAPFDTLTSDVLDNLLRRLSTACAWTTQHPSCRTLLRWLHEAGFSTAYATCDGGTFAGRVFDALPAGQRPASIEEVDACLRPLVAAAVEQRASTDSSPGTWDPWVTAVK